jgi:hypothetical protein
MNRLDAQILLAEVLAKLATRSHEASLIISAIRGVKHQDI